MDVRLSFVCVGVNRVVNAMAWGSAGIAYGGHNMVVLYDAEVSGRTRRGGGGAAWRGGATARAPVHVRAGCLLVAGASYNCPSFDEASSRPSHLPA